MRSGAGPRNRTATCCLEGSYSAVKPCPQTATVGSRVSVPYTPAAEPNTRLELDVVRLALCHPGPCDLDEGRLLFHLLERPRSQVAHSGSKSAHELHQHLRH